jgi:hypothetical protein
LHASPEKLWEYGTAPRQDTEFMACYSHRKVGPILEEIHAYFLREQEDYVTSSPGRGWLRR